MVKAADFVPFDCTSQEKAVRSQVVFAMQEESKMASKEAPNDSDCTRNGPCVRRISRDRVRQRAPAQVKR